MKWGLAMFLHDNKELFEEVIFNTADFYKLPIAIIEKDYYVTLVLKEIATRNPDIVFKGGTSLSKCYKIIDRFSEDIDLNIMGDTKPGESKRRNLKAHIVDAIEYCKLTLTEPESIRSRRDFNKYVIDYPRNGANCENILIHGKGNIFGGGRELAENIIALEKAKPEYAELCTKEKYDDDEVLAGRIRPRLINISNCRNVILDGLTVGYGPSWNIHMIYSENIVTANCKIVSKGVWNGDGWNPDSSTNCTIFNCIFEAGDDCIAIKSGKNPEGNIINRPCKDIQIFDCKCLEGFGGIAIGSEMSGGVENVKVWDCDFAKVRHGLQIKATKKRGGYVRNIIVKKTIIPCILLHSVWYNDDGIAAPTAPIFEDCLFENIDITGKAYVKPAAKTFEGIPDEVDYCSIDIAGFDSEEYAARNIKFKDIRIKQIGENSQKIMLKFSKGITFENISCK